MAETKDKNTENKKEKKSKKDKSTQEQQYDQNKNNQQEEKVVEQVKEDQSKSSNQKEKNNNQDKSEKKSKPQKSEKEKLQEQLQEQKDKYMRLVAEFENYKKRTSKERLDLFKSANREVMQALLPVIDDFDRAMKEIEKDNDDQFKGIKLIHNKLNDTLKSQGLTKINVKEGDKFDADIHEAVTQIPAPNSEMKGKIVDVVEKGYSLGEKILRFPKVVTGK